MLQYRLYGGKALPANLEGFVKAGANIGSVIGQFAFGECNFVSISQYLIFIFAAQVILPMRWVVKPYVCPRNSSLVPILTNRSRRKGTHAHYHRYYSDHDDPHWFVYSSSLLQSVLIRLFQALCLRIHVSFILGYSVSS